MLEGEENSLLESSLGDNLAKHFMLCLHVLAANGGNPLDEGLSLRSERPSPADTGHEVLLLLAAVVEVSPLAKEGAEFCFGLAASHAVDHLHGGDLVGVDALAVKVQLTPQEEELLPHFVRHVSIDYRISLVVLVYNVKGLSVPDAEEGALPVDDVVAEDALEFVDLGLQIDHDLGRGVNFLQPELLLATDVLVQNLEKQLGHQGFHVLLVCVLGVDPLSVHVADVCLILVVEFIHPADHVVPLGSQVRKLLVQSYFVLSVLHFLAFKVLELAL